MDNAPRLETVDILDDDDDGDVMVASGVAPSRQFASAMDESAIMTPPTGSDASSSAQTAASGSSSSVADNNSPASSSAASAAHSHTELVAQPTQYSFEITVEQPEQVGEGAFAHVTFKVLTKTNHPSMRSSIFAVVRRYREFDWLHDMLSRAHRECIIPPIPEKERSLVSSVRLSAAFKEFRRRELQRFLRRVAEHATLSNHSSFHLFLSSPDDQFEAARKRMAAGISDESGQKDQDNDKKEPAPASSGGWMSSISAAVSKVVGTSVEDKDEFFKDRMVKLNEYEQLLEAAARAVNALVKRIKETADSQQEFAVAVQAANMQSAGETVWTLQPVQGGAKDRAVAESMTKLAGVETQVSIMMRQLAENITVEFEDSLRDYVRYVAAVRTMLGYRLEVLAALQAAERNLQTKKEKLTSSTMQGPKGQQVQQEVESAERNHSDKQMLFDRVTLAARAELRRFEDQKVREMRTTIRELVQLQIRFDAGASDLWKRLLLKTEDARDAQKKLAAAGYVGGGLVAESPSSASAAAAASPAAVGGAD